MILGEEIVVCIQSIHALDSMSHLTIFLVLQATELADLAVATAAMTSDTPAANVLLLHNSCIQILPSALPTIFVLATWACTGTSWSTESVSPCLQPKVACPGL